MAKPTTPKAPFKAIKGAAMLGEGAGTLLDTGTAGAANADGPGAAAPSLSTLISTFCPFWQWPGTPHKKKWWP